MKKRICLLLCALSLTGCGHDPYEIPKDAVINKNFISFPVYSENTNLHDLIGEHNVEILTENKPLNTEELGQKTEVIEYKYGKKIYKFDLHYEVIDTIKPVFINASSVRTVALNNEIYPCEEAVFGDNFDKEPICTIEGAYDLATVGTYHVEYVLKDSSNNETRKNLKINVVDSIAPQTNTPKQKQTLPFTEVLANYKKENTMIGIDVSRWQTDIDFQAIKESGVEFVIMRIGVNTDIDKDLSMDSYFEKNIKGAKEAGLKVGVYVYTTATTKERAKEHALWVVNTLQGQTLDFPIAFDWENWSSFRKYKISTHDLSECFNTFYDTVKMHGYDAMLYSSKFYLENIWENKNNRPVWLAHYTSHTTYEGNYFLWQMSNIGRVNGIKGDVDIDILYLDKMQ